MLKLMAAWATPATRFTTLRALLLGGKSLRPVDTTDKRGSIGI